MVHLKRSQFWHDLRDAHLRRIIFRPSKPYHLVRLHRGEHLPQFPICFLIVSIIPFFALNCSFSNHTYASRNPWGDFARIHCLMQFSMFMRVYRNVFSVFFSAGEDKIRVPNTRDRDKEAYGGTFIHRRFAPKVPCGERNFWSATMPSVPAKGRGVELRTLVHKKKMSFL